MTITLIVLMCCSGGFIVGAAFGMSVLRRQHADASVSDALLEKWRKERAENNPEMPRLRVVKGGGR